MRWFSSKNENRFWRVKTPTVIQMEAVECGAASLAIILGYWGRFVPLEELREACGVSRDGSNAFNVLKAAKSYGLEGEGLRLSFEELNQIHTPVIVFWEYNHFLVLEGIGKKWIYLNDPAIGPRRITHEEFIHSYCGIVIAFEKTQDFQKGGKKENLIQALYRRLSRDQFPILFLLLASLCLIIPGLALPAFTRIFIDDLLMSSTISWQGTFIVSIFFATIMGGFLIWFQQFFLNRLNATLSIQFASDFLWHVLRLPVSFFTQRFSGEIAYRASLNETSVKMITGSLATTFLDLLIVIFYGIVMLQYNWMIGLIGFAAAALNFFVFFLVQRSRSDAYARVQQETGKWVGQSIGALQNMDAIKAAGIESEFFNRFVGFYAKNLNAQQEIGKKDAILGTLPILTQLLAVTALLTIGSLKVMQGELTVGMLMALQTLMISFLTPIGRFVNFGQTLQNLKINLDRLDDVMKNKQDPIYDKPKEVVNSYEKLYGYVEFRNVSFGYSPLAKPLIQGMSFTLKPGERLALVGLSGSGKSTLAKLAEGLYRPWSGEILYDGKSFSQIPNKTFQLSVASVDQEIFLFSGTIRENLTLWNPTVTDEMLLSACQDAWIHEEIISREKGYETLLTEGGRNFSGGQRQRFEIARALLYNPSILILDEAMSSLDSELEKTISDRIRRRGCTAIMIAHRLSTIQDCDLIIVLDQGQEVERGTHLELKEKKGLYWNLVESERGFHD